jgi:hypothetical protein
MTENDMVGLLQARYTRYRLGTNADRYVRARQVRYPNTRVFNETVFTAGQAVAIADYLVQDMYGQCPLIGFEIKVSRSDWLAELRNPGKAQWWRRHCNQWYVAASSRDIVRGDLPEGWGLMVPNRSGKLMIVERALYTTRPEPLDRFAQAQFRRAIAQTREWELFNV